MRRIHVGTSVALAAVLITGVSVPAAQAAPSRPGAPDAASSAVLAPTTFGQAATSITSMTSAQAQREAAQDAQVLAYWTPERLASAVPYESTRAAAGRDGGTQQSTAASAHGRAGSTPPAAPLLESTPATRSDGAIAASAAGVAVDPQATPVTNFPNTNGKLFFNGYGAGNAYCSASALNTDTKRVVITAGHCVYDGGAWMQNVVFVPNYDNRNADPDPVGIWTVHTLRTFNSWINDEDFTHDVGMATLNNGGDNNQRIVDAVGGHGLYWNGSYAFDVSIFGYPSNKTDPNGRYTMWACWGTTFQSGNEDSINGCAFGPGASGGPWLYNFSNTTGLGYVRSVTSTWQESSGENWGSYFTDDEKTMMDATNGDW